MKDAEHWDFKWNGWVSKILVRDFVVNMGLAVFWYYWIHYKTANVHDMHPLKFEQSHPE